MLNDTVSGGAHSELVLGLAGAEARVSLSTTNALMPDLPFDGSVHGQDDERAGTGAVGDELLCAIQHPRVAVPDARVLMAAASVPDTGSVRHQLPIRSPDASAGSLRFFCSGVAATRMVLTAQPVVGLDGEGETTVMAGDLLDHNGEPHVVAVGAAVFIGHQDTHKSLTSKDLNHLIRITFGAVQACA